MRVQTDVIVVGAGIGSMCAAAILGAHGLNVELFEAAERLGGKAGELTINGLAFDTGPSVLTLPHVFEEIFTPLGMSFAEEVSLTEPSPAFRYIYPDGLALDVFANLEQTFDSVRSALGSESARQLQSYMRNVARIWEVAAPQFVFQDAPSVRRLILSGPRAWAASLRIDAFSTMAKVIDQTVSEPHLRTLLKRYATYNGSDPRQAPGTLGCIAHVELALGGFGVRGGLHRLVEALGRALDRAGVRVRCGTPVEKILSNGGNVTGVRLRTGEQILSKRIIFGGDAAALSAGLVDAYPQSGPRGERSMSAHTAVFRAKRDPQRVAHTVVFPSNYDEEFADIFDRKRGPLEPTLYLCDQSACHERPSCDGDVAVFAMINAPATSSNYDGNDRDRVLSRMQSIIEKEKLFSERYECLWWRTPRDLAERFTDSDGSIYGSSSNHMRAAFQRPANRSPLSGLYLASGSAHPGGGVPMVAQSGKLAARALIRDMQSNHNQKKATS